MDHVEEKRHEAHWRDIEENVVRYLLGGGGGLMAAATALEAAAGSTSEIDSPNRKSITSLACSRSTLSK